MPPDSLSSIDAISPHASASSGLGICGTGSSSCRAACACTCRRSPLNSIRVAGITECRDLRGEECLVQHTWLVCFGGHTHSCGQVATAARPQLFRRSVVCVYAVAVVAKKSPQYQEDPTLHMLTSSLLREHQFKQILSVAAVGLGSMKPKMPDQTCMLPTLASAADKTYHGQTRREAPGKAYYIAKAALR
eukprot:jgi/Ulvmu1/1370/UM011_0098.1